MYVVFTHIVIKHRIDKQKIKDVNNRKQMICHRNRNSQDGYVNIHY